MARESTYPAGETHRQGTWLPVPIAPMERIGRAATAQHHWPVGWGHHTKLSGPGPHASSRPPHASAMATLARAPQHPPEHGERPLEVDAYEFGPAPGGWEENAKDLRALLKERPLRPRELRRWVAGKFDRVYRILVEDAKERDSSGQETMDAIEAATKANALDDLTGFYHFEEDLVAALIGAAKRGKGEIVGSRIMWWIWDFGSCTLPLSNMIRMAAAYKRLYG